MEPTKQKEDIQENREDPASMKQRILKEIKPKFTGLKYPFYNEPDSKSKDINAPKQEDTGERYSNEKKYLNKCPNRQPTYQNLCCTSTYRKPRYHFDEPRTMNDEHVYGEEHSLTKEKDLDADVINNSFRYLSMQSGELDTYPDAIENMTYKSYRDAQAYDTAKYVVVIPETNMNVASPSESSTSGAFTSRSVTGQSDKTTKIHYEDPDKDSGLSELEHFLLHLKSLSPTDSEASSPQANTRQAYHATRELSIDPKILHPAERCKLSDTESGLSESENSESEILESEYYNIEQKLVEDDTESGTAPSNNTTDPPTLREDSAVSNGTSESPPQPNDIEIQNNGNRLRNTRPLPLEADTYELDKFSKNVMLIINQELVEGFPELRTGTKEDVNALMRTFGNYGFKPEEYKDKTVTEVLNILSEFSKRDFTDYGCIAIAILTHGTRYGLLRARNANEQYSEHTVLNYLNVSKNPTLLTKPIILIIQACRGNDEAMGFRTNKTINVSRDHASPTEDYYLPIHSDTLVLHSSFYGKPAFRPDEGSWFIQTLCEKINMHSRELDLVSIITKVQNAVAIKKSFWEYSPETHEMEVNKQMPVMTSTLIRKLYLIDGDDERWPITSNQPQSYDTVDAVCRNADTKVHCSCFIGHFNYLKNCLSHFVNENPTDRKDSPALYLLQEANKIDQNYDGTKAQTTLIAISNFLQNNSRHLNYHKYLYFYRNINHRSDSGSYRWRRFCQNYVPIGAALVISSLVYKMVNDTFGNL